jgi:KaiC/GvpD/RAD55 family RecA-like ATPase
MVEPPIIPWSPASRELVDRATHLEHRGFVPPGTSERLQDGLRSVTAAALVAEPAPLFDALVERLFPAIGVTLVAGDPKSMKTMLALELALAVASPTVGSVFGLPIVRHGPVIFVEEEGGRRKLAERTAMQAAGLDVPVPEDLHFVLHQGVRLDTDGSVRALLALVERIEPVMVALDPLVLLHSGDENKASDMGKLMRRLVRLAADHQLCVVLVHHVSKPQEGRRLSRTAQRLRGSSAFAGATDGTIILDREGDYGLTVRGEYRDQEDVELYLTLDPATLLLTPADPPESARKIGRDALAAWVEECREVGVRATAEHFEVTRVTARDALEEAARAGRIDRVDRGGSAGVLYLVMGP